MAVILGHIYTSVKQTYRKAIGKSVFVVSVGKIAEMVRNDPDMVIYRGKSEYKKHRNKNRASRNSEINLFLFGLYEKIYKKGNYGKNCGSYQYNLPYFEIYRHYAPYRFKKCKIGSGKRCHPETAHDKVCYAECRPDRAEKYHPRLPFFEKQGYRKRKEYYQEIKEKQMKTGKEEDERLYERAPARNLGKKRQAERHRKSHKQTSVRCKIQYSPHFLVVSVHIFPQISKRYYYTASSEICQVKIS